MVPYFHSLKKFRNLWPMAQGIKTRFGLNWMLNYIFLKDENVSLGKMVDILIFLENQK